MAEATEMSGRLHGHVEVLTAREFRGWAAVTDYTDVLDVYLFVDGRVIAHARADQERLDVVRAGYPGPRVGFSGVFPRDLAPGATVGAFVAGAGIVSPLCISVAEEVVAMEAEAVDALGTFEGALDYVGHDRAMGWAWLPALPAVAVQLEVWRDGELVTSTRADRLRPDLLLAGRGTGLYGFEIQAEIPEPDSCQLWMAHGTHRVRLSDHVEPIGQLVSLDQPNAGIRGHVDHLTNYDADGWAFAEAAPQTVLYVQASLGDRIIGRAVADRPRQDLLAHGLGTGNYGFKMAFSEPLQAGEVPVFSALQHVGEIEAPETVKVVIRPNASVEPASFEAFQSAHHRYTSPGPLYEEFDPAIIKRVDQQDAPKILAFYLPQFHAIDQNDKFWGTGFTEWRQLARAVSRFPGHYQPRIPRDLGFYNLTNIEDIRRQCELALACGISAFAYYFYYFDGQRVLERPLDTLLSSDIPMPFVLIWANENWTRTWDGSESEVLLAQSYELFDEDNLLSTFASYLVDNRYLRLNGRPLLFIYNPAAIPDTKETVTRWRSKLKQDFNLNPLFYMCQTFGVGDPSSYGFDGAMEFPPHKIAAKVKSRPVPDAYSKEFTGQVVSYDDFVAASLSERPVDYPLIKTAVPSWDNDARRPGRGFILEGSLPSKYQDWLAELVRRAHHNKVEGASIVAVNAWNEWAESAYLEPDVYFGAAYANATARAVVSGVEAAKLGGPAFGFDPDLMSLRVSVIVPNFNHAKFITERLTSIIHQTRRPDEIIFLDDASSDDSLTIATALLEASGIPFKIVANEENSGSVFKQWLRGIDLASHPVIWIAESDDSAAEDLLATLLAALKDPSVSLAFGRIISVDGEGQELGDLQNYMDEVESISWHESSTTPAAKLFERDFVIKNLVPNASGAIFRRPRLTTEERERLVEYRFAGDWYFYMKVLRGGRLAYRHRAQSYFRISQSSASRDALKTEYHLKDHERLLRDLRLEYGLSDAALEGHLEALRAYMPAEDVAAMGVRVGDPTEAPRRPLRICIGSHGFAVGGGEAVPIALANSLKDAGHHVTLLVVDADGLMVEGSLAARLRNDIPVVRWADVESEADLFFSTYRFDVINSHNIAIDSRISRTDAEFDTPYVISMHGGYENAPEYVDDRLVDFIRARVAKIVLLAEKNRAGLDRRGIPPETFVKAFNALPSATASHTETTRAALGVDKDAVVLAQFSRAIEAKGWQTAINAVQKLNGEEGQRFVLLLGGDGPDLAAIQERNAGRDDVIFLGNVSDPTSILPICDASVLATTYVGETFPLSILESFSCGLPVFTTDLGEIPAMMADRGKGVPGAVLDHTLEPTVLADRLASVLDAFAKDRDLQREMGAAAMLATDAYSMSRLVNFYEALFHEAIALGRQK